MSAEKEAKKLQSKKKDRIFSTPVKAVFRADFDFEICFQSDEKGLISFEIEPFSWSE